MNLKTLALPCLLITALFSTTLPAEVIDRVVAQVDEDVVLESELLRKIKNAKKQLIASGSQLPPDDVLYDELLEQLIMQSLQVQMAERAGMRVSPGELQQIATQIAQQNNMTLDQFSLATAQDGIPFPLFVDDVRKEVLTTRFREAFVRQRIKISEKEVESLVQSINSKIKVQFHLGHIMISADENAPQSTIDQAREEAQSVLTRLNRGEDFAAVAKAVSDSPDAQQGGDFGWRTEDQMPTLFAEKVSFLMKGDTSPIIRSPSGFHILRLFDKNGEQQHVVQQTNTRHILIKPDAITTEEQAVSLLTRIREQVIAGTSDFNEEAKKHSDDPGSGNLGGELGWVNNGIFDPLFEQTIASLEVDEISMPFQSSFGWHIVQLLGKRSDDQTDEMKRQQAAQMIQQRKFSEEVENWMREIRDEAYVKKIVEAEE